jgi:hypothetical protein
VLAIKYKGGVMLMADTLGTITTTTPTTTTIAANDNDDNEKVQLL